MQGTFGLSESRAFGDESPVRGSALRVAFRALCVWTGLALWLRRPQEVSALEGLARWPLDEVFGPASGWTRKEGLGRLGCGGRGGWLEARGGKASKLVVEPSIPGE